MVYLSRQVTACLCVCVSVFACIGVKSHVNILASLCFSSLQARGAVSDFLHILSLWQHKGL